MIKSLKKYILPFPFIFGLWPVLSLIANNIYEISPGDGFRAIFFSLCFTLVLIVCLTLLTRDPLKSSLITSLLIVLFFSYGHLYKLLVEFTFFGQSLARHRYLVLIYLVLLVILAWIIIRTKRDLSIWIRILNILAVSLLIIPIYQITTYQINQSRADRKAKENLVTSLDVHLPEDQVSRDVYFIVADGYPRSDFITQYMDIDNSGFLDGLRSRGFFVAECSQANYTTTHGSIAATLNMEYLREDDTDSAGSIPPQHDLDAMIRNNKVQTIFSGLGYQVVTFENGYPWLNWGKSDIHINLPWQNPQLGFFRKSINDFEILVLDTTIVRLLLDLSILPDLKEFIIPITDWDTPGRPRGENILYMLETLPEVPTSIEGRKFVYFHVVFPHPPYVFDSEGNFLEEEPTDELNAYADHITYLNSRLLEIIDTILEQSVPEPVIVIQSDHGASIDYKNLDIDNANRLGILNALYLPPTPNGDPIDQVYSTISPVNTFRLIFDNYFQAGFGLLEDRSIVGKRGLFTTLKCSPISQ